MTFTCHERVMIDRTGHHARNCPSFRPAQGDRRVTCAGCDCEPGTTCDTRKNCTYCGNHKTYCDSLSPVTCCERCRHVAT